MVKLEGQAGSGFAIASVGTSLLALVAVIWGARVLPCDASQTLAQPGSIIVSLLACEIAAIVRGAVGRNRSGGLRTTGLWLGIVLLPLMPIAFVLLGVGHCGFGMATGLEAGT